MRLKIFFILFIVAFVSIPPVFAKDSSESLNTDDSMQKTATTGQPLEPTRELKSMHAEQLRADLKPMLEQERKSIRERIHEKRDEVKKEIESKKEEFKAALEKIKDARKKEIVENIDERLSMINQNRTDHFAKSLEKMTKILDRIASKGADLKAKGKDTVSLELAITDARTAISKAEAAVSEQTAKDYTADINGNSIKDSMSDVRKTLQADLQKVRDLVQDAKKAVMLAARELGKARGGAVEPTVTIAPTSLPPSPTLAVTPTAEVTLTATVAPTP